MSYQYGGFHDSCLEYEIVSANGEVLICTSDNENSLIFQMIHGTFGTLGIITKLTFKLIPSKPFIKVVYKRYKTLNEYKQAIWDHFEKRDIDFMDGMIHSPNLFVLSIG
jgi:FAD/FMN-containing dehydrogenase